MQYNTIHVTCSAHPERNGQECSIVKTITEPDSEHDAEVLPMLVIRFADGFVMDAFPDEVA